MPEIPDGLLPNSRREFLLLTAATALCGCQSFEQPGGAATSHGQPRQVDAGPASTYARDGVYSTYRDLGFFIIRAGGKLSALSSYCTHRRCKLTAEADHSFYCHCHGSTFDPAGKVTEGPAVRNLPDLPTSVDANGHFIVSVAV